MILSEMSGLSRKPSLLAKNYPVDDFLLGGGSRSQQFDLAATEEKEPVNVMQIGEMLEFMKQCAEKRNMEGIYGS